LQYISQQKIPAAALADLRDNFLTQTAATMPDKPTEVLAKIVEGRLAKWCKEVTLFC
jgi:translation elongation factor EF-Ts